MLREPIWRDLRLAERGVHVDPAGPSLNLYEDGAALHVHDDVGETQREFARFSGADAAALPAFETELGQLAELISLLIDTMPPDAGGRRPRDLALAKLGAAGGAAAAADRRRQLPLLHLRHPVSGRATVQLRAMRWPRLAARDQRLGRRSSTPGTAYVLLHDHASEQASGGIRRWGFVGGGSAR